MAKLLGRWTCNLVVRKIATGKDEGCYFRNFTIDVSLWLLNH